MYKSISVKEYKSYLELPDSYEIKGFMVYGTYKNYPYDELIEELKNYPNSSYRNLGDFLTPVTEFTINGNKYWFVTAYGGAMLSEYLHLACLFGSKKNIVIGSCGGLNKQGKARDIIIPSYSYGNESTTRAYSPDSNDHYSNSALSKELTLSLKDKYRIWNGPTITYQAMMAETKEDVDNWSKQGYYGVEMEASTVFAISNHFNVPSAAVVMIADNLITEESVIDEDYQESRELRRETSKDILTESLKVLING